MIPLYGLVLAGGKSSRMGRDKAALILHDKPQVVHIAEMIMPYVERLVVSARKEQWGETCLHGFELVADEYQSPSPLNGIVSAMNRYPHVAWLVVAVDMPGITYEAIERLIIGRNMCYPATTFSSPVKGGNDPLFAIWEPDKGHQLKERLLAAGHEHVCPRKILSFIGAHTIKRHVDSNVLANINTPEELEEWRRQNDHS